MNEPDAQLALAARRDAENVAAAQRGDRRAFDRLVLSYQDMIVGLCVRLLGSRQEGEDAAQDVFVKAFRNLASFRGDAKFSTWVYTIAVNTCRNRQQSFWRTLWRGSVKLDAPVQGEDGEQSREIGDTSMLPSKDLERHRLNRALNAALAGLSQRHRELVVMRDIKDLAYEEIAAITGVPEGTVKSGLNRARAAMRDALKGVVDDT